MGAKLNLVGKQFGRWTVISKAEKPEHLSNQGQYWFCVCQCGNTNIISTGGLTSGNSKSCGCYDSDVTAERNRKNRKYPEGDSGSKIYNVWNAMHKRCESNGKDAKDYKDRGIKVCEEWNDFLVFKEWAILSGFKEGLSIDRIDVNGNYEPNNCRWADAITQANNKTNNRKITINGETKTLAEWSKESGLGHKTITYRIDHGWKENEILSKPNELRPEKQIGYNRERRLNKEKELAMA